MKLQQGTELIEEHYPPRYFSVLPTLYFKREKARYRLRKSKQANFMRVQIVFIPKFATFFFIYLMSVPRLFGHLEHTPLNSACYHNQPSNTAVFPCFSPQRKFRGKVTRKDGRIRQTPFCEIKKGVLLGRPTGRGVLRRGWWKDFGGFEIFYSGIGFPPPPGSAVS